MIVTALIPLPLFHNPDEQGGRRPIEDEHFTRTAEEISTMFQGGGTLSVFPDGQVRGFWWDRGVVDRDVLALLEVDLEDTPENRETLRAYARDVLRRRFLQKAIYVKWIGPIETWTVKEEEEVD